MYYNTDSDNQNIGRFILEVGNHKTMICCKIVHHEDSYVMIEIDEYHFYAIFLKISLFPMTFFNEFLE